MDSWKVIIGDGKTFTGAVMLILVGLLGLVGWLPAGVHLDVSPLTAISGGLISIGLGAKLQKIIDLWKAFGLPAVVGSVSGPEAGAS